MVYDLYNLQLEGKIGLVAYGGDLVTLTISKHGVKVLNKDKKVCSIMALICYYSLILTLYIPI